MIALRVWNYQVMAARSDRLDNFLSDEHYAREGWPLVARRAVEAARYMRDLLQRLKVPFDAIRYEGTVIKDPFLQQVRVVGGRKVGELVMGIDDEMHWEAMRRVAEGIEGGQHEGREHLLHLFDVSMVRLAMVRLFQDRQRVCLYTGGPWGATPQAIDRWAILLRGLEVRQLGDTARYLVPTWGVDASEPPENQAEFEAARRRMIHMGVQWANIWTEGLPAIGGATDARGGTVMGTEENYRARGGRSHIGSLKAHTMLLGNNGERFGEVWDEAVEPGPGQVSNIAVNINGEMATEAGRARLERLVRTAAGMSPATSWDGGT